MEGGEGNPKDILKPIVKQEVPSPQAPESVTPSQEKGGFWRKLFGKGKIGETNPAQTQPPIPAGEQNQIPQNESSNTAAKESPWVAGLGNQDTHHQPTEADHEKQWTGGK